MVAFETRLANTPQGGGRPTEIALLNEEQTTLLITYMRNSDIVRTFKKAIVKAFFEMRKKLAKRQPVISEKRSTHLPMMEALVETRAEAGKETKAHHFIIENKLCNWAITGSFEPINESELTIDEVQLLGFARRFNESLILIGVDYDERKRQLAIQVDRKRRKLTKLLAA